MHSNRSRQNIQIQTSKFFLSIIIFFRIYVNWQSLYIIGTVALIILLYRFLLQRRLGGTTGDTAGALVEIVETVVLLFFVVFETLLK